ncbi:hypothetical protein LS71_008315 [Helicobacter jaachi]|uniref:Uncharacterized protein n=1 Tax=Helicobacter jaachi TaxID=1677920 RepID=A0A4U8T745_9HELI|nr:hypothetical protein [Helicobacter jaachi]TLD95401.1 hypothetical protein LS71_008315 [Helicobacter jaachi]
MGNFINVRIDSDTLLSMLCNRVDEFGGNMYDDEERMLFKNMYEHYVDAGIFEERKFDVMHIVDNDLVNYCSILTESDSEFLKVQALAKQGKDDISCQTCFSLIEASNDDFSKILVRH